MDQYHKRLPIELNITTCKCPNIIDLKIKLDNKSFIDT